MSCLKKYYCDTADHRVLAVSGT